MMKKSLLFASLILSALAVSTTYAGKKSWTDLFKMRASLCVYWECPSIFMKATNMNQVIDIEGRRALMQTVTKSRVDAKFFAERVVFTEPGNEPEQLYRMVSIRLHPGDQVTTTSGYSESAVMHVENSRIWNLDDYQAYAVKINGRSLISKELALAHRATQSLMFDGIIRPPNNQYNSATNARLLNKTLLGL